MAFASRLAGVSLVDPGKRHPWPTPYRPNLPLWRAQFGALFQNAGAQGVGLRILHGAGIKRAATVFTECKNPLVAAGGGLYKGARRAFQQLEPGRRGRDIGSECRARVRLAVEAMTDRHAAWLNLRLEFNRAALALAFYFHMVPRFTGLAPGPLLADGTPMAAGGRLTVHCSHTQRQSAACADRQTTRSWFRAGRRHDCFAACADYVVSVTLIECDRPRLAVFLANHHCAGELVIPALLAAVKSDPENSQTQWQT